MSSSNGDGGSRVSIPADLRKTIQNIREVTGKQHSDEDIFSVFKDCFNDPHETTQKLLYLDTFHEVRSKRERKKENFVPNTQGRGRNSRRNVASSYTDANNGRSAAFKKQSGDHHTIGGSRTALPSTNKAVNDTIPRSVKASNLVSPASEVSNHRIQDAFVSPVNKGVKMEQLLSKSTSSEDVVELDNSKATAVPLAVLDSVVENDTQYAKDGTFQILQQSPTFTKQDHMLIATSNCSSQSEQVIRSEAAANKGKNQSLLKSDECEGSHVTFPVHLQVAKMLENGLTFGSFDSNFVKEASSDNCPTGCADSNIESSHGTAAYAVSARKNISTFSQDKDFEISNLAPEQELALLSDQTVSEGCKLKEDFVPITDTLQAADCDALPVSYPDQCSIAASQQAMHLYRQQYPLNFFPYGPYFPPFYMPQPYIHQFLTANGFQQQFYLPPRDGAPAPPGAKLPLDHIKSGSDIGNSPSSTLPCPYDSYTVALNHIPLAATVNSCYKDEKKENGYTTGSLVSLSPPLPSLSVHDMQSLANLQASPMFNFSLQGQPLAFPTVQPGFTGLYQQTQPILAAQPISAMTEPIGLPHS